MGANLSCANGRSCTSDQTPKKKKKKEGWKMKKKRKTFLDDVDTRRKGIDNVCTKAAEILPTLSMHDTELVEEHIRTSERKYGELQATAEKKQRSYATLGGDLGHIKMEAEQYIRWLEDTNSSLTTELRLGCHPDDVDQRLNETQELNAILEEKEITLEAVKKQAEALLTDLPGPERQSVELLVRQVQAQHAQVVQMVTTRRAKLEESRQLRREFETWVTKEQDWLDGRVKVAEKLDAVRLLASDVEKQADECKSLAAKVQSRSSQLEELNNSGQQLKEECTEEGAEQVDGKLTELTEQQQSLTERLKQQEEHLRNCAAARRLYEADSQKVEHWCHETDITCSTELPSDCASEVLEEKVKQYKTLANAAHIFDSLVKETVERGEGFKPHLHENELPVLNQQLASLQDKFNSTSTTVRERLQSLESSLTSRQEVQNSLQSSTAWLENMQDQIKAADCPPGATAEQAHSSLQHFQTLEQTLAEYQPSMAELNSKVESLRTEGQPNSQAEDILRLTSQYEMLIDKVAGCLSNRQAAISVRQQHENKLAEIQKTLEDGRKELESVPETVVSALPERLQRYKELKEKLTALQPEVSIAEDHARQISIDCSQEDRTTVLAQVETAKEELSALSALLDKQVEQCRQIQHDRDDFEAAMNETIQWLEAKEDILASLRPLHLDSDKVDPVMEKHKVVSGEALQKLSVIKQKAKMERQHFQELQEQVPEPFAHKLQEIDDLQLSIQGAIEKKEQYLQEAKTDRKQLETSMRQVSDWLRGAEEMLDSGVDGLDYSTLDQTLSEFTDYFSEASLCQDEVEQVTELSDKLLNTLDSNDTETLHKSLASVNKRLAHVTASSQKKQQLLETKTGELHSYQEGMHGLSESLEQLESELQELETGTLTSPQELNTQLERVKVFTAKLEDTRNSVGAVNETARSLLRTANPDSASNINRLMLTLNHRWEELVSHAEGKQAAMEELSSQWQEFSTSVNGAEDVISFAQETMATVTTTADTQAELVEQLDVLRSVNDELDSVNPQIERLKMSSATLQKALPSAEAKVTLQDQFIKLLENYERLQGSVSEQLSQTQDELDDRDNFHTEVVQTLSWLTDTQRSLYAMDPDADNATDNVEKCKIYQQEILVRMEQMRRLTMLQETKYASLGRDVPYEMRQQLEEMHDLEKELSAALREKMEELKHLREDREEYRATVAIVTKWLQEADQQLQERIISIPQTRHAHQTLLSQFEEFKQSLDKLRSKGGDIIRHSSDQSEKQDVQKTIASINHQWLSLQASTADRTQELSEAADLAHAVEDVAQSVENWVVQAEGVVGVELEWNDFGSVREQLKSHKRLTKELEQNEDKLVALNAMVKQLDQVCDTEDSMASLGALRQRVAHVGGQGQGRLSLLEDANKKIEDYEKEIAELRKWMEETRTHISMRDTTRDLKEQLAVQERVFSYVLSNYSAEVPTVLRC